MTMFGAATQMAPGITDPVHFVMIRSRCEPRYLLSEYVIIATAVVQRNRGGVA
jgi:hypothetical protein